MISGDNSNEAFNAISHLLAALLALAGLVLLIVFSAIERK